jgi:hypothetical protein
MVKIKIECVGCGHIEYVGIEQRDQPFCPKWFMPMMATSVIAKTKEDQEK